MFHFLGLDLVSVVDPVFPGEGGDTNPYGGQADLLFDQFFLKLYKNEILAGGVPCPSPGPPLGLEQNSTRMQSNFFVPGTMYI